MDSRKRPLSPDQQDPAARNIGLRRYSRDPSSALATFAPAPPSERFNLPPLSSLTAFNGGPPPQMHMGRESSPPTGNKRMRLDDGGAQDLNAGRRPSMQGMQELPGIASITGRPPQLSNQLPLFQTALSNASSAPSTATEPDHRSIRPGSGRSSITEYGASGHPVLPSFKTFGQEALGDPLAYGDQARYGSPSGAHYPPPASSVPPSNASTQAALMSGSRMTLPPFNASSPVSKVPKPPAASMYKREHGAAPSRPSPLNSPHMSPVLGAASASIPPPPASFFHSTSLSSVSPFSSGAFGVPPYGTNYYSSNIKRMEAEKRDCSSTVLSKLPQPPPLHGQRSTSNLGELDNLNVGALLHAANVGSSSSPRGGQDSMVDIEGSDSSSSDLEESEEPKAMSLLKGKRRSIADSETGETLGRVLNMGSRKADFEKAKEEARRKRKPGDVAVVNDERLMRVPRNSEQRHLGHIVYSGPRVRRPGSTRVEDIELSLLPRFTSEHHYATIDVRVPAYLLTFKSNVATRKSAVWGTDVYTDDSDIVAMVIHSGWYKAIDSPDLQQAQLKALSSAARRNSLVQAKPEKNANTTGEQRDLEDGAGGASSRPSEAEPLQVLPIPPLAPVMGTVDPCDGLASHDLHITLRILPRLVKYTGSLRNGIESRGWGSSHDGESIRIETVKAVSKGSVSRHGKKSRTNEWNSMARAVAREMLALEKENAAANTKRRTEGKKLAEGHENLTVVFSEVLGEACMKYSPRLLVEWPPYLREQRRMLDRISSLQPPQSQSQQQEFSMAELDHMRDWPYWRVRLVKDSLIFEDKNSKRYELTITGDEHSIPKPQMLSNTIYRLIEHPKPYRHATKTAPSSSTLVDNFSWHDIEWTESGLGFSNGKQVSVIKFFWKCRNPISPPPPPSPPAKKADLTPQPLPALSNAESASIDHVDAPMEVDTKLDEVDPVMDTNPVAPAVNEPETVDATEMPIPGPSVAIPEKPTKFENREQPETQKPSEVEKAAKPEKPKQSAEPQKSTAAEKATKLDLPANPQKPDLMEVETTQKPAKPAEPSTYTDAEKATRLEKPVEPEKPAEVEKSTETEKSKEPPKAPVVEKLQDPASMNSNTSIPTPQSPQKPPQTTESKREDIEEDLELGELVDDEPQSMEMDEAVPPGPTEPNLTLPPVPQNLNLPRMETDPTDAMDVDEVPEQIRAAEKLKE
ncbi:hypothetical protein DFJ77DRAFT_455346 [Powellomyces hirtus]|nr:hypothetical protein DFJ77DRAFT_455346 [Powellomyces hirtus]